MTVTTVGRSYPRHVPEREWTPREGAQEWDHQFALAVLYDDDIDPDDPRLDAPAHLAAL